jgi:hypothetical protein
MPLGHKKAEKITGFSDLGTEAFQSAPAAEAFGKLL